MFNEIVDGIIKFFILVCFILGIYTCVYIIKNTIQPSGSILYDIDTIHKQQMREKQLELERYRKLYYKIHQIQTTDSLYEQKPTLYLDSTAYNNHDPLYSYRNDIQDIRDMQSKLRRDQRLDEARMTRSF